MNKKLIEVFKVLPEYKKVSKKRKLSVLTLLIEWANNEIIELTK